MYIAASVDRPGMDAVIPQVMDRAAGVLIFDTESEEQPQFITQNLVRAMIDKQCEALLCGFIYDSGLFESIADAGITRYLAADMTVTQAVRAMDAYQLEYIRDYVGGAGHPPHTHEYHHGCDGQCDGCGQDCGGHSG